MYRVFVFSYIYYNKRFFILLFLCLLSVYRELEKEGHLSRGIEGGYSNNPCQTWDSNPQPSG